MLLKSIRLSNILSFGEMEDEIRMENLNVLIGPNGSGKSNFMEVIHLLSSAPGDLHTPIRKGGGGIGDWLWKGAENPVASIDAVFNLEKYSPHPGKPGIRHVLSITGENQRFTIIDEKIENEKPFDSSHKEPYFYYKFENGHGCLNIKEDNGESRHRELQREDINTVQSILSQRKDPHHYPEITSLGKALSDIRLYREWNFNRHTAARLPQPTDRPNDMLEANAGNLALVLNKLQNDYSARERLLEFLKALYEDIEDYRVSIEGGTVQLFFDEGFRTNIPATRLSDGTLRYLCLLAILCHPKPPPLVCIEEPELGLHPDVLPTLAELFHEASERCQLIITTHSDILVDAMSDRPECVLVTEKSNKGTRLTRLDKDKLKHWLEDYRLGELWTRGEIGGNRW